MKSQNENSSNDNKNIVNTIETSKQGSAKIKVKSIINFPILKRFLIFDVLGRQKKWRPPALFALLFLLFAILGYLFRDTAERPYFLIVTLLVIAILVPGVYFLTFFNSINKQKKLFRINRDKLAYTLEFSNREDGIHIYTPKENVHYKWTDVSKVYDRGDAYYLYIRGIKAFILPEKEIKPVKTELDHLFFEKLGDWR